VPALQRSAASGHAGQAEQSQFFSIVFQAKGYEASFRPLLTSLAAPTVSHECKHLFQLSQVCLYDVGDMDGGFFHCFQLVYIADQNEVLSYTFLAQNDEEKDQWLRSFSRCPIRTILAIR
jgi:hypothetical protein